MAKSIQISDAEMDILQQEASLTRRSLAGQAEYWMRIGRAVEQCPDFSYQRVQDALKGLVSPDHLTGEEQEVFFDQLSDAMEQPTPEQIAFFAERRRLGLGVGLDDEGNLVKQQPEGQ